MHGRLARNGHALLDHLLFDGSLCLFLVLPVPLLFLLEHLLGLFLIQMSVCISLALEAAASTLVHAVAHVISHIVHLVTTTVSAATS